MKWFALCSLFAVFAWFGVIQEEVAMPVHKGAVEMGRQRPFSFYYPYNYKYYYPHRTSNGKAGSCYWVYTNGAYVYTCS